MKPYTTSEKIRSDFADGRRSPGAIFGMNYHFHPRARAAQLQLIREQLFQNEAVICVRLYGETIRVSDAIQIISYLSHCPKLESIEFIDVNFTRAVVDAVLVLLQICRKVYRFGIWRNEITQVDLQYLLSSVVQHRQITLIKCHQPHLSSEVLARALVFMLQHHHIRHFVWPIVTINRNCMQIICNGLRTNEVLPSLRLTGDDPACTVQQGAMYPLLTMLKHRKNHIDMALGVIEGDNQLEMLINFLRRNNTFRRLEIMNSLNDDELRKFSNAIQVNNSLNRFTFEDNLSGSDAFDAYDDAIEEKTFENRELNRRLSTAFAIVSLARIFLAKAQPMSESVKSPILTIPQDILVRLFQDMYVNTFTDLEIVLLFSYASQFQTKLSTKYEMAELLSRNHLFAQAQAIEINDQHTYPIENPAKRLRR